MVGARTPEGVSWVDDNVSMETGDAEAFPCEDRYIEELSIGMLDAGLSVAKDGHRLSVRDEANDRIVMMDV